MSRIQIIELAKNCYKEVQLGFVKFITKLISNHNILTFQKPQYLVTNPVYRIKQDLITVIEDGRTSMLLDFFEVNREQILKP